MVLEARPSGGNSADAENVGTAGVGVFKQKTNGKLQFKKLNLGSNKISITDDTPNDEVDVDVVPSNIAHQDLSGAGTNAHSSIDSHISSTSNPHSVTKSQVGLGNVTDDAQLKRAAGDINSFTQKLTPVANDIFLIEDSADSNNKKKILFSQLPGANGGEANTASNQGVGGVGLYHSKVGVDLQFKNINAGSSKITVTDDPTNKEVDIDVVQGNIDHGSLAGLGDDDHTIYVKGPASATNNAIVRFDSTTGKLVKNSNVTIDDSGNVVSPASIMSLYYSAASEGESTSTTGWAAKLSMTNTYVAGTYKLEWYYEQRVSNTNTTVGCRVQDTTAAATYAETGSNDVNYHGMGGVYVFTIAAGSRTIEIQFQRSAGNGTAYIRRARLLMTRIA